MFKYKDSIIEASLIILFTLILILVGVTGFLVWKRTEVTLDKAEIGLQPKENLMLIKGINSDMIEAENMILAFNLSRDSSHMKDYDLIVRKTAVKLLDLRAYSHQDKSFSSEVDTLTDLVADKYLIMDSLAHLRNNYRVSEAMKKVVRRTSAVKQNVSDQKNDSGLMEKLFRKKRDRQRKQQESEQNSTELSKLKSDLYTLNSTESRKELINNNIEYQLLQTEKKLTEAINVILLNLEKEEREHLKIELNIGAEAAKDTQGIMLVFLTLLILLISLSAYLIRSYLNKNKEHQLFLIESGKQKEELAASKLRFISILSHEIKTPLHAISGFSEQLMKNPNSQNGKSETIEMINESARHLMQIVNDVLDYTKLEFNKVAILKEPFNPAEQIEFALQLFQKNVDSKNVELSFDNQWKKRVVLGDQIKWRQIVVNLISNAVKFTDSGSIHVQLLALTQSDRQVLVKLVVKDTGIGIDEKELKSIFEEFKQENDHITVKYGGSGLGLNIVSLLVELHGGYITVRSEKGKGSEFTVEIPYQIGTSDIPQIDKKQEEFVSLENMTILIADDEPYNIKLLRKMLEGMPCQILEATNGNEALEMAKIFNPDVILMDIRMPDKNGVEAAIEIREAFKGKENHILSIVALSAGITEEIKNKDLDIFDAFLDKPFRENELFEIVFGIKKDLNTQSKDENPDVQPLFNLETLKKTTGTNTSFFKEMVETFIESTQNGLNEMSVNLKKSELNQIQLVAHRIAAPCKHLEAVALYELLKQIEHAKEIDPVEKWLNEAHLLFNQIKELLEIEFQSSK